MGVSLWSLGLTLAVFVLILGIKKLFYWKYNQLVNTLTPRVIPDGHFYRVLVLRDIAIEILYETETWCDDAEEKRLRYEAYARRFLKRFEKAA